MGTCTITAVFKDATGAVIPGHVVTYTPANPDTLRAQDGAVQVGKPVKITADGAGAATFTLKSGPYVYQTQTEQGPVRGAIKVPDAASATLDAILATPDGVYELMSWPAVQAVIAAASVVYSSVTAGVAAVADGTAFVAVSDDSIVLVRRVAGSPVIIFPEVI